MLIHQPDESLPDVMAELVRCSSRFLLWAEYHAPRTEAVPYHGEEAALFRRDHGALYARAHPGLSVIEKRFLDRSAGFDRITWQLLGRH